MAERTLFPLTHNGALTDSGTQMLTSIALAIVIASYGRSKKSLNNTGFGAAILVGTVTFYCGIRFGITLIAFFMSSSRITKVNQKVKAERDAEFKEGGQRNWVQVFSNSISATLIAVFHFALYGEPRPLSAEFSLSNALQFAFLAHYACCNGDTWASELGILEKTWPILVTTFKQVPPGTNGGVSKTGMVASVLGGAFIGAVWWLIPYSAEPAKTGAQWPAILLCAAAGVIGSLLDSLLGATLQFSGYLPGLHKAVNSPHVQMAGEDGKVTTVQVQHISGTDVLDNHQVNFVSALGTAIVFAFIGHNFYAVV